MKQKKIIFLSLLFLIFILFALIILVKISNQHQSTSSKSDVATLNIMQSDADIVLAVQALENFFKQSDNEIVISGVYILHKEEQDKQKRILFYATSSVLKTNSDGSNETIRKISAPFELYAVTIPSADQYLTFCGRLLAPRHFGPDDWEDIGISEENYDPELLLRKDIQQKASPKIAEQAEQFLDLNPNFAEEMWELLFNKPSSNVTKQEMSEQFYVLKGLTSDLQLQSNISN